VVQKLAQSNECLFAVCYLFIYLHKLQNMIKDGSIQQYFKQEYWFCLLNKHDTFNEYVTHKACWYLLILFQAVFFMLKYAVPYPHL